MVPGANVFSKCLVPLPILKLNLAVVGASKKKQNLAFCGASSFCPFEVLLNLALAFPFSEVQMIKNLPAMQETQVQPLGQEDLLEKEMATHSSILAQKIPWVEKPGGL